MINTADWRENCSIIPLKDMSDEDIKIGIERVFLEARALLSDEGYVLDSTLTARHKDANTPLFKERYAKNGFEYRTITNIDGWMVRFKYQRYRTRQKNKVKGTELEVKFIDLNPRRVKFNTETISVVRSLYEKYYTVPEIISMYRMQTGIELKESTIRNWVKNVVRQKRDLTINVLDMEKAVRAQISVEKVSKKGS